MVAATRATDTEAFLTLARPRLRAEGWSTLDWGETGRRAALLKDGRHCLEALLNDPTFPVPGDAGRPGEKRTPGVARQVETLFGTVPLQRAYYHAAAAQTGRYPLDQALGRIGPCTPGRARLLHRAGAQTGFASGSEDLRARAASS